MLRRIILSILFTTCFAASLSALEVDVDEIYKSEKIEFINYEGKRGKFETSDQIKSIGYQLGYKASKGEYNERFRYHMKYSVVRVDGEGDRKKYSADIIFIDKDARVDHIKNVRRIIAAYLEQVYDYTPEQARSLAVFITYYNAVHRKDMDYFKTMYRDRVMDYITEKNAGIAIRYDQWPGRTALLIPLTTESKRGKIDTIDPFEISRREVKDEVKKEKETGKDREELVKLKEKETGKEKRDLEKDKKRTDDAKKETEKKRTDLEKKKDEVKKEKEKLEKEKDEAKKIKDPEERKRKEDEIKKKDDELKEKERETKKEEEKVKREEEQVKKDEKENKEREEDIKKKEAETKKEKEELKEEKTDTADTKSDGELKEKEDELKKKEEELDRREDRLRDKETDPNVYALKIYYLEVKEYLEGGHYNNELYMINTKTKKIEFKSPVTNICGRRYDIFSGGIVVITHQGSHVSGHRLTLIDRKKLTALKTGTDNIFWRSFIEIREGYIYAIVKEGDNYYLGKFDTDLKLIVKSKEKVHQNTFITFYEDYIYINREDMTIMILKKDDFSLVDVIRP